MKRNRLIYSLILIGFVFLDCSDALFAASKRSLAVMDFEGIGVSDIECQVITERFRAELSRTDHFLVLDRRQMAQVLQEEDLNDWVGIGKKLNVERLLMGSISRIGSAFSVVSNLIDATTGQTVKTVIEDHKGSIDGLLQGGIQRASERLADFEGTGYLAFVGPRKNDRPCTVVTDCFDGHF